MCLIVVQNNKMYIKLLWSVPTGTVLQNFGYIICIKILSIKTQVLTEVVQIKVILSEISTNMKGKIKFIKTLCAWPHFPTAASLTLYRKNILTHRCRTNRDLQNALCCSCNTHNLAPQHPLEEILHNVV